MKLNAVQKMRVLSGMSPEFPVRPGRRPQLHAGLHAYVLTRFNHMTKPKLGRPTFASYSEKLQTYFQF